MTMINVLDGIKTAVQSLELACQTDDLPSAEVWRSTVWRLTTNLDDKAERKIEELKDRLERVRNDPEKGVAVVLDRGA